MKPIRKQIRIEFTYAEIQDRITWDPDKIVLCKEKVEPVHVPEVIEDVLERQGVDWTYFTVMLEEVEVWDDPRNYRVYNIKYVLLPNEREIRLTQEANARLATGV